MLKFYGPVLVMLVLMFVVAFAGGVDKGLSLIGATLEWLFGMALIAFIIYQINEASKK